MKSVGVFVVAVLFTTSTAHATIWYVHPDSALNTIQAGINTSSTSDTVLVAEGIYTENINFNGKNIVLGSLFLTTGDTSYISSTVIESSGSVVTFISGEDSTALLTGFTIQNGYATWGGGIYCVNSSPCLSDVIISGNTAYSFDGYGGAIFCDSSSLSLTNVTISDNSVGGWVHAAGGGIACGNSSLNLTNVAISGNTAGAGGFWSGSGGGIYCHNSSLNLANVKISGNSTQRLGGGIACFNSSLNLTNVTISENSVGTGGGMFSGYGGGICLMDSINTSLANVSISGNSAYGGGGIYCYNTSPSLSNITISENTASSSGGGIFLYESSPTISGNTISGNTSIEEGGGILCEGSSPVISNCTISYNSEYGVYCPPDQYGNPSTPEIFCNDIYDNVGFGVCAGTTIVISADSNWWGDATGPYHPTANPGGLGDTVSDYVDFDPWLSWPVGIKEHPIVKPIETHETLTATIFRGPLQLRQGKKCKVYDIAGRVVDAERITRGIYFIETDGIVTQKVIKVR
jgi:parallel beta-helix repeat protein